MELKEEEREVDSLLEVFEMEEEYTAIVGRKTTGRKKQWLKYLLIVIVALLVIAITVAILILKIGTDEKFEETQKIYGSQQCIEAASRISSQMNINIDPCEDFNEFVCGNFSSHAVLSEDMSQYHSDTAEEELIYFQGKEIMEEDDDEDWPLVKKAKQYYKSCMDENRLKELGLETMKEKLKHFGGWPVIEGDQWNGDGFMWQDNVYEMGRNGFSTDFIVSLKVIPELLDSSSKMLLLDYPTLILHKKYLANSWNGTEVQEYYSYMKATAILFGADPKRAEVEMKEALLFELAISEDSPLDSFDMNYNSDTYLWNKYVKNLLGITKSTTYKSIEMFGSFNWFGSRKISAMLEETKPRVIANYLGWRATESVLIRLNRDARKITGNFRHKVSGDGINLPRYKECLKEAGFNSYTDNNFWIPLASVYVKKHVSEEMKKEITLLTKYIKANFKQELLNTPWLDKDTKRAAVLKLTKMNHFIAYPEELLDQVIVENHFDGLNISETEYLGNYNRLNLWDRKFKFGRLNKKVEKKDSWMDHSWVTVVNAFNSIRENAVTFSPGLIHGTFYNKEVPNYLTFGSVGTMIGHELVHGFDNDGRLLDFKGNLNDWWSESANNNFIMKTACFVDQYSNFYSDQVGMYLNGKVTLGDNIADNGGLNQAYLAYENWVKSNGGEEPRLPGLEQFTPRQLFFISYGQTWCSKYSDTKLKDIIEIDAHSPANFRILGPISNSLYFANVFGCKKGSEMNPVNKCHVW